MLPRHAVRAARVRVGQEQLEELEMPFARAAQQRRLAVAIAHIQVAALVGKQRRRHMQVVALGAHVQRGAVLRRTQIRLRAKLKQARTKIRVSQRRGNEQRRNTVPTVATKREIESLTFEKKNR